ncbi:sigma 54-interacting transcriptional regulator [Blastopirellula sp. JC732]|uniref:Sigma 54-interacting transcriptional regulator n=1 Tax=Blastopirellula sediminis TaxID=2894196 RepID=A0A9X1MRJ1_9BACT|nr:helix-turn-helix domain-containing protein [Blastopirellula sediminis]MCC9605149.1 sigma 54-interacting transcriptional regulator [Blastopirellula sediminis]MCC9631551.1 sigma 54-interacting transcriptional regulator [Blastopirellula sediminis]
MARPRTRPASLLAQILNDHAYPVYAIDQNQQLAYINDACRAALGEEADELLGMKCRYHAAGQLPPRDQLAADLAPPPDVFAGGRAEVPLTLPAGEGQSGQYSVQFSPLQYEGGAFGALAICYPRAGAGEGSQADRRHDQLRIWRRSWRQRFSTSRLVGESAAIRRVRRQIALSSTSRLPVVIFGPVGSGREHTARTVCYARHGEGSGPVISIRSELMDAEMIQSTVRSFVRRCEEADDASNASLILLDADQLPGDAQSELFHLLRLIDMDLRIVSTARHSLLERAEHGKFREDLAYQLSTIEISLPPLCDRPEDIPLLSQALIEQLNLEGARQLRGLTEAAADALLDYDWPGNIDELAAVIAEAAAATSSVWIDADQLPKKIRHALEAKRFAAKPAEPIELDAFLAQVEEELIRRALEQTKGNKSKAAELLGVSRARLHRRLESTDSAEPTDD